MKLVVLAGLLALVACGGPVAGVYAVAPASTHGPVTEEPRYCTQAGGFEVPLCRYELRELAGIHDDVAVEVRGYLKRGPGGVLSVAPSPDGSGAVPITQINPEHAEGWYLDAVEGRLVVVRGHYRHEQRALDVLSLRWVQEEGREPPSFPPPAQRGRPSARPIDPAQP